MLTLLLFLNILLTLMDNPAKEKLMLNQEVITFLGETYNFNKADFLLIVSPKEQEMYVIKNGVLKNTYTVSTSKYGLGQTAGSYKTPLGPHLIKQKIGDGAKPGSVFRARVFTGIVAEVVHEPVETNDDYVTTRILWLDGLIEGFNKGSGIDSYNRYIYIHGTHEEGLIGKAASHGCVRMRNLDVIELYELVPTGTFVYILDEKNQLIENDSPQILTGGLFGK